jgi:hypothetical protein
MTTPFQFGGASPTLWFLAGCIRLGWGFVWCFTNFIVDFLLGRWGLVGGLAAWSGRGCWGAGSLGAGRSFELKTSCAPVSCPCGRRCRRARGRGEEPLLTLCQKCPGPYTTSSAAGNRKRREGGRRKAYDTHVLQDDDQVELKTRLRDAVVARAAEHTVQIQYYDSGIPAAIGSGVLLEIGSALFVVTASHVIEQAEGLGALAATGGLGKSDSIDLRNRPGISAKAPHDICMIELNPSEKTKWQKLRPIRVGDLGVRDNQHADNWYVMLGFPERMFSPDQDSKLVRSQGFVYASHAASNPSVLKRIDAAINISLEWYPDANRGDWYPNDFVTPYGMSGCGIWRVPRENIPKDINSIRPDLIGIATHSWPDEKVFIGTRIEHVLGVISRQYPNLANAINIVLPTSIRAR